MSSNQRGSSPLLNTSAIKSWISPAKPKPKSECESSSSDEGLPPMDDDKKPQDDQSNDEEIPSSSNPCFPPPHIHHHRHQTKTNAAGKDDVGLIKRDENYFGILSSPAGINDSIAGSSSSTVQSKNISSTVDDSIDSNTSTGDMLNDSIATFGIEGLTTGLAGTPAFKNAGLTPYHRHQTKTTDAVGLDDSFSSDVEGLTPGYVDTPAFKHRKQPKTPAEVGMDDSFISDVEEISPIYQRVSSGASSLFNSPFPLLDNTSIQKKPKKDADAWSNTGTTSSSVSGRGRDFEELPDDLAISEAFEQVVGVLEYLGDGKKKKKGGFFSSVFTFIVGTGKIAKKLVIDKVVGIYKFVAGTPDVAVQEAERDGEGEERQTSPSNTEFTIGETDKDDVQESERGGGKDEGDEEGVKREETIG